MTDQQSLIDEADNLHLAAAFGAFQGVNFPDLFDALTPGFRWNFLLLRFGYIENVYCSSVTAFDILLTFFLCGGSSYALQLVPSAHTNP